MYKQLQKSIKKDFWSRYLNAKYDKQISGSEAASKSLERFKKAILIKD